MVSESSPPASTPESQFVAWLVALSLATDLANGAPSGTALGGALLAERAATTLGLSATEIGAATYVALFRYLGCTSYAHEEAELFGDERAAIDAFAPIDKKDAVGILQGVATIGRDEPLPRRATRFARVIATGKTFQKNFEASHCEAAVTLTRRLDVTPAIREGLAALYERWDGDGGPARLRGVGIPIAARVLHATREALVHFLRRGGEAAARACLEERAGGQLDPDIVRPLLASDSFFAVFRTEQLWSEGSATLLRHLSSAFTRIPDREVIADVFGDIADLKCPIFLGHSRRVAELSYQTALAVNLGEAAARTIRVAASLHDIGMVAVSNRVWQKGGPLDPIDWERVRLHAYYGERICQTIGAEIASLVGHHHERSDGSGYARGAVPDLARGVIAAADVCVALGEDRPHRPAMSEERVASTLEKEVREGRLRRDVVHVLLGALGRKPRRSGPDVATLTEREREVLRLVARGMSNKEIAGALSISPRTVQIHTIHSYDKLGVRTRAGAALRATELGLL